LIAPYDYATINRGRPTLPREASPRVLHHRPLGSSVHSCSDTRHTHPNPDITFSTVPPSFTSNRVCSLHLETESSESSSLSWRIWCNLSTLQYCCCMTPERFSVKAPLCYTSWLSDLNLSKKRYNEGFIYCGRNSQLQDLIDDGVPLAALTTRGR
jgi:hypothetical protein